MPKTLLLADDSVTIQKVVGISFANEDVVLLTVDNGNDAVTRAGEARPDIILADVVMPGKNGYEVCEAVKADPGLRHIPVLLLTGTFEAFDEERARRAGADGHITKPFEAQALVDEVNALLARVQQPAPPPAPPPVAEEVRTAPAPAPQPTAEPSALGGSDDAYDFFDDDLAQTDRPAEAPRSSHTETVVLSESGNTPAEPGTDTDPVRVVSTAAPAPGPAADPEEQATTLPRRPKAGDSWPSSDLGSALAEDDLPSLEVDELDAGGSEAPDLLAGQPEAQAIGAAGTAEPASPEPARAGPDERFDFDFEETPGSAELGGDDPLRDFGSGDLERETVLDPEAARSYDVSSSDLRDVVDLRGPDAAGEGSARDEAPETTAAPEPFAMHEASPEAAPPALPEPNRAAPAFALPAPAMPEPAQQASAQPPAPADPVFAQHDEPVASAVETAVDLDGGPVVELGADAEIEPETPPSAAPEREPTSPPPAPTPAPERAGPPDISPVMRQRIHDSLEKIAWEAFGDISDTIARRALERIEAIAWEVIPQMAEALIREEIRRLKGDEED